VRGQAFLQLGSSNQLAVNQKVSDTLAVLDKVGGVIIIVSIGIVVE